MTEANQSGSATPAVEEASSIDVGEDNVVLGSFTVPADEGTYWDETSHVINILNKYKFGEPITKGVVFIRGVRYDANLFETRFYEILKRGPTSDTITLYNTNSGEILEERVEEHDDTFTGRRFTKKKSSSKKTKKSGRRHDEDTDKVVVYPRIRNPIDMQ